jgi:hypothetical protein
MGKTAEGAQVMTMTIDGVEADLRRLGYNGYADVIRAHLAQPAQAVDVDYVPGELDRTAPERIWLQIDTNHYGDSRDEPWPGADGVTWQDESVGGLEIQYVRADLVHRALAGEKAEGWRDGWTARRVEELRLWHVHSPSGDIAGVYDQAADVHAEVLRQLAQSLPTPPTDGEG